MKKIPSKTKKKVKKEEKKPIQVTPTSHRLSSKVVHSISNSKSQSNDNLYICINDITLKKKYLLESLKYSLILQEEHERIKEIRSAKIEVLDEIKKEMEALNVKYQSLKKVLPNVKNVISYTEKELNELDMQVEVLKKDVRNKNREIEIDEKTYEDVASGMRLAKSKKFGFIEQNSTQIKSKEEKIKEPKQPLTKIERIQNNLKLIESKLKNI